MADTLAAIQKLQYAIQSKNMIKSALVEQHQDVDDTTPLRAYAQSVLDIQGGTEGATATALSPSSCFVGDLYDDKTPIRIMEVSS